MGIFNSAKLLFPFFNSSSSVVPRSAVQEQKYIFSLGCQNADEIEAQFSFIYQLWFGQIISLGSDVKTPQREHL